MNRTRHALPRQFAYVGEPLNRNGSARRGESFKARLEAAGFSCATYASQVPHDDDTDEHQLAAWLNALPKPVALLAAMDTRARQVIDLCTESGLRVPQDVAVLRIDDDELLCNGSIPTLSSIRRDTVVCTRCGYSTDVHLRRIFKRRFGCSMREYRTRLQ